MTDTLAKIVAHKREILKARKREMPQPVLEAKASGMAPARGFAAALDAVQGRHALIAEIKRASPSKGLIREDFDPVKLARAYVNGGAACLSVLTEEKWFEGADKYLTAVRSAIHLPVLRKDFIVDPYQIAESRVLGADAILLIMAALNRYEARDLELMAIDQGLEVLIEVHDEAELEKALKLRSPLIGINNRNLKTLEVDLTTTERLAGQVPKDRIVVAESGLASIDDLDRLSSAGARAFLVGETLMREDDVGAATRSLIGA
ncbi:MAG: indole-3-glycerol phosphate synthase TrpC [Pacificimonas sp.]